ncbi:Hypothetical protein CINCED_3A006020 [Cinara cedri]|uniref:Uncharacterized protein n=1 Tax=Cinara cedri TaxID=506608 RepID=A0A5E4MT59_9HEMI|nr:Hypothetical protein CINCED_3A006020 [Cinara cedri]
MSCLKMVQSKRGKPAVIYQRYFYTQLKILNNHNIVFMCPKKNCYASIKTDPHLYSVIEQRGEHKEPQLTNLQIENYEIKNIARNNKAKKKHTVRENISTKQTAENFNMPIKMEYESVSSTEMNINCPQEEQIHQETTPTKKKNKTILPKKNIELEPGHGGANITETLSIMRTIAENRNNISEKDECDIYGEYVGKKLKSFDKRTRAILQNQINNLIFNMEMNPPIVQPPNVMYLTPANS